MSLLIDALYATGLAVTSPVWLYKMIRHGRYRSDFGQRFGAVPIRYGRQPIIWVHCVSLGEANAARTLVAELHSQLPDFQVVVSSTTDTGMEAARRNFAPDHVVFRWPLDFTLSVRRALERLRPALVVLLEGEVWPNFLGACNRHGVPVVVVNGRMSADKGYPGYKKLGPLARMLFNRLTAIGVQDEAYAQRYRSLGVDAAKLHVTGMIKFDTPVADTVPGQEALATALGLRPEHRLVVAGGTGPGEEQIVLDAWKQLAAKHPQARLALVPRKPERFDEAAKLIEQAGWTCARRSQHADGTADCGPQSSVGSVGSDGSQDRLPANTVILGDTMGELRKFYALAHAVFVGRSLVPMGGSDMIEAAALGKAVCYGPHTFNFPQAAELLRHGCMQVADGAALTAQLDRWLTDEPSAAGAGKTAQDFVRSQSGATRRNVDMICQVLGRVPAAAPGTIATDTIQSR